MYILEQDKETGRYIILSPDGTELRTFEEDCFFEAERLIDQLNEYYGN